MTGSIREAKTLLLDVRRRDVFLLCKHSTSIPVISRKLGKHMDTIRYHVRLLEKAGLVERKFRGVKCTEVVLTAFGLQMMHEIGEYE